MSRSGDAEAKARTSGARRRRGLARRHRGQAIIEMAFVMGILLILSFGMVDFGLFLTGEIRATNCAREVARAAVVRNPNAATVCGSGSQLVPLFDNVTVTISPNYLTANAGTAITATVTGTYRWKAIGTLINELYPGGQLWSATTTITATETMRMEGQRS